MKKVLDDKAAQPAACSHGVDVRHLWGMTELSPLGTLGTLTAGQIGDGITQAEVLTAKVSRQDLQ